MIERAKNEFVYNMFTCKHRFVVMCVCVYVCTMGGIGMMDNPLKSKKIS